MEMPVSTFNEYYRCIFVLEATEMLQQINVASYPYQKKEQQKKFYNDLKSQVSENVYSDDDNKVLTTADIAQNLARKLVNG